MVAKHGAHHAGPGGLDGQDALTCKQERGGGGANGDHPANLPNSLLTERPWPCYEGQQLNRQMNFNTPQDPNHWHSCSPGPWISSPLSVSSTGCTPKKGSVALPGLHSHANGSGAIIEQPVSVCHQVSMMGQRPSPTTCGQHVRRLLVKAN